MRVFLLSFIIVLTLSCNTEGKQKEVNKQLFTHKNFKIPIAEDEFDLSYLSMVKEIKDSTYVFRKARYSNSIYVYNWETKQRINKIDFQNFGPSRIVNFSQGAIYPLTKKSFFIGTINNVYETMLDSVVYHSTLMNTINNKQKTNPYDNRDMFFIAAQNHFPSFQINNKIYSRLGASGGDLGTNAFYNSRLLMEYDLKTKEYKKLNFKYPYFYYNNCWGPSRTRFSMTLNNKEEVICLFPIKPMLYKYNIKTERIIDSIEVKSNYASSDLKPINCKVSNEKKMYHTFTNPMFRVIKYDKYKDIYYMFITLPITKEKYDSIKTPFAINPFSIIVLDKDFKNLGEQKFKGGIYHTSDFFVTKEGLWLSKNNPHNSKYDENELIFTLLTLNQSIK